MAQKAPRRREKSSGAGRIGVLVNTSLRWNSIWSHSHELIYQLAGRFRIIYYELPRLTVRRSDVLFEHNDFPRPAIEFVTSERTFASLGLGYLLHYWWHSVRTFIVRRKDFSIFLTYNVYEVLNLSLARLLGKKVVFIFADEYDELTTIPRAKPFLRWALKRFLRRADLVVATAKTMEERARRYNDNVVYLPNGVNLDDVPKRIVKRKHKGFVAGFLGSLERWVDFDAVIEAAKHHPEIRFEIIGGGSRADAFKRAARKSKNIVFVGYIKHETVYGRIAQWDAAIIAFHINKITNSVSPIKLFEYWLVRLPVLASPTTELAQFPDELLYFRNGAELSEHLTFLEKHPKEAAHMGREGERLVREKYNWQAYGAAYEKLLEGVL